MQLLSTKQRYKMKAIHNKFEEDEFEALTVVNKAKIQNESNSQQDLKLMLSEVNCCQQSKDTK